MDARRHAALPTVPSRRRLLQTLGAGAVGLLAGCGEQGADRPAGNENDSTSRRAEAPDETDRTFVTTEFTSPKYANFNPFDPLRYPTQSPRVIFGSLVNYSEREQGLKPRLAETSLPFDTDTGILTVTLRDHYWHDGDPVRARDVVTRFRLEKLVNGTVWNEWDWIRAADEKTVEIKLTNDAGNRNVIGYRLIATLIDTKYSEYEEYLPPEGKSYEDLTNYQRSRLQNGLVNFRNRDPVGWGPFKLTEIGDRRIVLDRHDQYPAEINFPRYEFKYLSTDQAKWQALIGGDLDGAHAVPTATVEQRVPDRYREYTFPRRVGMGLAFQYDRDMFKDRRVRKAIAHVINKEQVVRNSGISARLAPVSPADSGMVVNWDAQRDAFGEVLDKLTTYDVDHERATSLLRAAGWEQRDGRWHDATGEPARITIKVPASFTYWVNIAQSAATNLSDFGIEANFKAEEITVYYGQTMPQGRFDMAGYFVGGASAVPYFSFSWIWHGIPVVNEEHNMPLEYEVPFPIGDPDGSRRTVNVDDQLERIATHTYNTDPVRAGNRLLAWTFNQTLPVYPLHSTVGIGYMDTSKWGGPPTEHVDEFYPLHSMLNAGDLWAKADG